MQTPHKLRCVGWLLAMLTLLGGRLCAQSGSDFSDELYLDSWNQVVGITYDSTGIMYVWEKGGRVYVVNDSVRQSTPLLDISEEVGSWGAHGMLGFALDPAYLTNGRIYVLYAVDRHHLLYFGTPSYSASANIINNATIGRITRYTVVNPGDPTNAYVDYNTRQILLGATAEDGFPITANTHGVGSLLFGTDGTLLASCGDGAFPSGEDFGSQPETWYLQALADGILNDTTNCGAYRAQSLHSLSGKLLRIDPETGEGLASNPYYDPTEPSSVQSRIWALGLRQPFRMTLMPGTGGHYPSEGDPGVVVIGDVGSGNREEINICNQPGLNFGWPLYEGMGTMSSYYNQIEPNLAAPTPGGCGQSYYRDRKSVV
jgi:glucose/arabinose dehydrogenase